MNASSFLTPSFKHHHFNFNSIPSITHQTSTSLSIIRFRTFNNNPSKMNNNHKTNPQLSFSESAYESERLRLDTKARESMAIEAAEIDSEDSKAWKWVIRKRIWDLLEGKNIAQFPRPVHHRIPNFVGAPAAADRLSRLEVFLKADCVKVNPDTPQKQVRLLTLNDQFY